MAKKLVWASHYQWNGIIYWGPFKLLTFKLFQQMSCDVEVMWCRVNYWEWECLTLANKTHLLSRRLSRSLQEPRGGVHLLNSRRLDQCHMWHFQMPAAGAANSSQNGIATINRLSKERFRNCFVHQDDNCKHKNQLKLNAFEKPPFLAVQTRVWQLDKWHCNSLLEHMTSHWLVLMISH